MYERLPTCALSGLPLEMMRPSHRLARWFRLQIKHVLPEIVQLRLVELCWQNSVDRVLEIFERSAQTGYNGIGLDTHRHDFLEGLPLHQQNCLPRLDCVGVRIGLRGNAFSALSQSLDYAEGPCRGL